jgi:hypothetical protein
MYAVLSKENELSWKVLRVIDKPSFADGYSDSLLESKISMIDNAFANNSSLTGMETTSFGDTVRVGSIWDGVSFSGGPAKPEEYVDIWNDNKRFSFLSDNTVILNFIVNNGSPSAEYISDKFKEEVILVQIPQDQGVSIGEIHGWDGSRFIEV